MLRTDYENFISFCIKHKNELNPFTLFHYRTNKKYPFTIARFIDTRYSLKHEGIIDCKFGLFVDIYPIDTFDPNDKVFLKKRNILIQKIYLNSGDKFCLTNIKASNIIKTFIKRGLYIFYHITFARKRLLKKMDKMAIKNSKKSADCADCTAWIVNLKPYKTVWFNQLEKHFFEEIEINIPSHYDDYLKMCYGNYMKMPPVEERIPHHFYKVYKNISE